MYARADEILGNVQSWMREAAGDQPSVERAIEWAAFTLGISYSRAFNLWYGKARRVWADEYAEMAERARVLRERKRERLQAELARLDQEDADDVAAPLMAERAPGVAARKAGGAGR